MTKEAHKPRVQEGRDDLPIFIHSELDDYGLSCVEFRVYGRVARRAGGGGQHLESAVNMAKEFGVSEATVRRALKLLVLCRLVSKEIRRGKTSIYRLLPQRMWVPKVQVEHLRERALFKGDDEVEPLSPETGVVLSPQTGVKEGSPVTTDGGQEPTPVTTDGGGVSPQTGVVLSPQTDEGTPSEGTPPKVLPGTHTHALSPRSSPRPNAGGVCVPLGVTAYSLTQRREYGLAHPLSITEPERWVHSKRTCAGEFDEAIREWYTQGKPVEGSAATAKPADTSACPDCGGSGYYFEDPTRPETHRRCTHPRLAEGLARLQQQYDEAQAEMACASRS
jgi:hypothetical protein